MTSHLDSLGIIADNISHLDFMGIQPDPCIAPGSPTNITVTATSGTVTLTWVPPDDHGSGIAYYQIDGIPAGYEEILGTPTAMLSDLRLVAEDWTLNGTGTAAITAGTLSMTGIEGGIAATYPSADTASSYLFDNLSFSMLNSTVTDSDSWTGEMSWSITADDSDHAIYCTINPHGVQQDTMKISVYYGSEFHNTDPEYLPWDNTLKYWKVENGGEGGVTVYNSADPDVLGTPILSWGVSFNTVNLSFSNSTGSPYDAVERTWTVSNMSGINLNPVPPQPVHATTTNNTITFTALTNATSYTFTVKAVGSCSGQASELATVTATPKVNTNPVTVKAPQHSILIADCKTQDWVELTQLTGRHLTVNLSDPSQCTFSMSGDSSEAALLHESISDIKWLREGTPLFWGRLTNVEDSLSETPYDISCTAIDYRGLLDNREVLADNGLNYDPTDFVETVIWDLVNYAQTQVGGSLGVTKGIFPRTGLVIGSGDVTKPGISFGNTSKIWSSIKTLLAMEPSVEMDIDPVAKKLNIYYPQRGRLDPVKLDYGGMISKVTRSVDIPGQYANYTRTWASGIGVNFNLDADIEQVADLSSRPEGRWDQSFTISDLRTPLDDVVRKKSGQYNFNKSSRILPAMTLTLSPGQWAAIGGPAGLYIGDMANAIVRRGRLDINIITRVYSLDLTLDQSNNETLNVTVGLPKINPFKSLTNDLRRLKLS